MITLEQARQYLESLNLNPPREWDWGYAGKVRGCSSESGIMVFDRKTHPGKGAPFRCYHASIPTASVSPSTTGSFNCWRVGR